MTLAEFKQLSGLEVAEADYQDIQEVYYHTSGEFNAKQEFCPEFAKLYASPLFQELVRSFGIYVRGCKVADRESREAADLILRKAHEYDDQELLDRAVYLLGYKAVLKRKIAEGWTLTQEDRDYIVNNL